LARIGTEREWEERRRLILGNNKVYTNLKELIGLAHANRVSLAVFKPAKILEFVAEDVGPERPQERLEAILNNLKQGRLFEDESLEEFKIMSKLPLKFSYGFSVETGVKSTLMIEDWEVGQLYWNWVERYGKAKH
jgi:hypothetical protein